MRPARIVMLVLSFLFASRMRADAQSWQPLRNAPRFTPATAVLLTDGTVIVQQMNSRQWYRLTPDRTGSYVNGTWTVVPLMPSGYAPNEFASAVLADGRLLIIGGKFNLGVSADTPRGAIFNPFTSSAWSDLVGPPGWAKVGNVASAILADGRLLLGHASDAQAAILNPTTMMWSAASDGKTGDSDEGNWVLLQDGTVLAVNAHSGTMTEKFVPSLGRWVSAGSTPVQLATDGGVAGVAPELGPTITLANGTVFATGATGKTAIYTPGATPDSTGTWSTGPDIPLTASQGQLGLGPAALLPNGKVFFAASPAMTSGPLHFYEFDGATYTEMPAAPNSATYSADRARLMLLPSGEVLFFTDANEIDVYTPAASSTPAWAPMITSVPATIQIGATHQISGKRFNGVSQGSVYGDDAQLATNYPIVRITNRSTGHVFYARTHDHSTMGIGTGDTATSTSFDVPLLVEGGASDIAVIVNGVASAKSPITVDASSVAAAITTPAPRSTLASNSATFTWTAGTGVSQIWLDVGTTPGGTQIYSASQGSQLFSDGALALSRTVTNLPANGSTVYVRLWSFVTSGWTFTDYTYTATNPISAVMTSPTPGSTLDGSSVTFTWTSGLGVSQIWLDVGTTAGGAQIYSATQLLGVSRTVAGLPTNGSPVYVRLWTLSSMGWRFNDYTYTSSSPVPSTIVCPGVGATLAHSSATFEWTAGKLIILNWLDVGTTAGGSDLYSGAAARGAVSKTIAGLPSSGTVYVRLWSLGGGKWYYRDYSYTSTTTAVARMTAPTDTTFTSDTVTFGWTNPSGVVAVWLDLGTTVGGNDVYAGGQGTGTSKTVSVPTNGSRLYARLWTLMGGMWRYVDYGYTTVTLAPAAPSTMLYPGAGAILPDTTVTFEWTAGNRVRANWIDVGSTVGGNDLFAGGVAPGLLSKTVSGLRPAGGTVYVRLWSLNSEWSYADYSFPVATPTVANMTSPANQSPLSPGAVKFTWVKPSNITTLWLDLGTTPGGNDIYAASQGLKTAVTVSGLPTSGRIYARLWTLMGGLWRYVDYRYDAVPWVASAMTAPTAGSTIAASTTFTWTAGTGVTVIWIDVGTSPGGTTIYSGAQSGTVRSRLISGIPAGQTIYVRLWSLTSAGWTYTDYTYMS